MNKKTAFLTSLAFLMVGIPLAQAFVVSVEAPQEAACKTATVNRKDSVDVLPGTTVSLAATANAGWSFAGWYASYDETTGVFSNEVSLVGNADWRTASASYAVGTEDVTLYARFVEPKDDGLVFDFAGIFGIDPSTSLDADDPISPTNVYDRLVEVDSRSFPTLTVSGLPSGLEFDARSLTLTGSPSQPGSHSVAVSGKNASGFTYRQDFDLKVGNVVSERVSGTDWELYLGETLDPGWEVSDLFYIDDSDARIVSVALTGLPTGLEYAYDGYWEEYLVSGTPTKAGVFAVWATVRFSDGTVEKATALLTVLGPEPSDYDVDFSGLVGYSAGESIAFEEAVCIGEYDTVAHTGITGLTLPSGIAFEKVEDGSTCYYYVYGTFSAAGRFVCKATVAYEDWESELVLQTAVSQDVIVSDVPGVYLTVAVEDAQGCAGCKVTGGGVYAPGATAHLTATAARDFVFAGWHDEVGNPLTGLADDYRRTPLSYVISAGSENALYARFVAKELDTVTILDLDGRAFDLDLMGGGWMQESFTVVSPSFPTLTFKNLPAGVTCAADPEFSDSYVLSYDPLTAAKTPTPGRYDVTATAVNVSRDSDVAEFRITVANVTSAYINVRNDYGVLTPNVPMEPISFDGAVDFERGDTLAVSGLPSGLPAGLKYDAAKHELYGTPTKPGNYTLSFTATVWQEGVTVVKTLATAFITVKQFPEVAVTIEGESAEEAVLAGCKVTGSGNYKAGTKVNLKATAAKGWVFAGWSGVEDLSGLAELNPTLSYTVGTNDLTEIGATFIETRDDGLYVGDVWELGDESVSNTFLVVKGETVSTNLIACLMETRSLPTVTVTGLPSGLSFDKNTLLIKGKVTKTGVSYATVAAKNAGGYVFTRILRVAVLEDEDDPIPADVTLKNEAGIDFGGMSDLMTGDWCPAAAGVGFEVPTNPGTDASVKAVSVSGLPAGLTVTTALDAESGTAEVLLTGTPAKVGRFTVKVSVTYADNKRATSECAVIVSDGGSRWLDVLSLDETMGTVTGSGVYSSGATVKLSAKAATGSVFGGWYEDEGSAVFENLALMDGVDYRTAAASFVFRPGMFLDPSVPTLWADFGSKTDDAAPDIAFGEQEDWTIDPDSSDATEFWVDSFSLPKVTVTGAPKGVTVDAVRGIISYDATKAATVVPGWYTLTVKAVNQSNRSSSSTLKIFVANKTSEWIDGLLPDADAYQLMVGVAVPEDLIVPEVTNALTLTASGLPSGLKLQKETDPLTRKITRYWIEGVPTKVCTNTVTFTASGKIDGSQLKEVATVTLCVGALPQWSQGTFNGVYRTVSGDGSETNDSGTVALTVSAAGKVSGKILSGGKTFNLSSASLTSFDLIGELTSASVAVAWTTHSNETFVVDFGVNEDNQGIAFVYGLGGCGAELVQNVWLRQDLASPVFATGFKQPVMTTADGITCKFGAKGVVTLSGKVGVTSVSGSMQTLLGNSDLAAGANARLPVYAANRNFEGGAYCKVYDILLTDSDDDGKLDEVTMIRPAE